MPVTVTHAKNDTVADWSGTVTLGNSSGGSTTAVASNLVRPSDWNSAHQVTLSVAASEIASLFAFNAGLSSITAGGGISAGIQSVGYFEPFIPANTNSSLSAPGIGTWYFDPVMVPFALGSGQINCLMADVAGFVHGTSFSAASTGSLSRSQTLNNMFALYQLGTGASTTLLSRIWSADCSVLASWEMRLNTANTSSGTISNFLTLSFPAQWDASGGVTYSSTSASGTTALTTSTMASTRADNLITGAVAYLSGSRLQIFPFNTSVPAGQYWLGHMLTSTSSSAGTAGGIGNVGTLFQSQSRVHMLEFVGRAYKRLGLSVSNTSTAYQQFHGSVATVSSLPYLTLGTSDFRNLLTNGRVYWNYAQSTY